LFYFSLSFQYKLATIGVLKFLVVIYLYGQPVREKIKFYRTASQLSAAGIVAGNGHTSKMQVWTGPSAERMLPKMTR
jgi:hypothetical protein